MSDAAPAVYDPVELRRRIAVCFSVGELRTLAESLGVGGIAWERGIDEAAREVVRQSERYAGLPALVARLREVRPLVEWPEPLAAQPVASATGAMGALPLLPAPLLPSPGTLRAGPTQLSASPGTLVGAAVAPLGTSEAPLAPPGALATPEPSFGAPEQPPPAPNGAPPLLDPFAPPPGPPVIRVPPPPTASAWPGTTPAPAAQARGMDPRILVAVAGLMLVAAIVAYLAGRASSASGAETSAASSASPKPPGARSDGPAALASDALARSYENLARVCELPASAGGNELVFKRVFERCGKGASLRRPSAATPAPTSDAPDATPAPEPAAARTPRAPRNDTPGGGAPAARGCVGTCDASHAACRSRCGPEPTESSAYDAYQHCQGRCLTDASRCRLSCR